MDRVELIEEMQRSRLVAVVRSKSPEEALATAKAVAEAGLKFIEITFSVPRALDVIKRLVTDGRLHVGAGTVLSREQAREAVGVGVKFIVSPSLELDLIPICHEAAVACIPGAATIRAGGGEKFFPRRYGRRAAFHPPDVRPVPGSAFCGFGWREPDER